MAHLQPGLRQEVSLKTISLPFLEHNLSPPSDERKQQVEAGFIEVVLAAYALNEGDLPQPKSDIEESKPDMSDPKKVSLASANDERQGKRFARLNALACSTCGGRCCNQGGDSAFLDIDKFREIFRPVRLKLGCLAESQGKFRFGEPFSRSIVQDYTG